MFAGEGDLSKIKIPLDNGPSAIAGKIEASRYPNVNDARGRGRLPTGPVRHR
jgi:hypothetical protein